MVSKYDNVAIMRQVIEMLLVREDELQNDLSSLKTKYDNIKYKYEYNKKATKKADYECRAMKRVLMNVFGMRTRIINEKTLAARFEEIKNGK